MDEPLLIDRYLLFREIAAGGMAAIYLARQLGPVGFGRAVAVKRLHPNYARDPDFVAMFVDEARVVTSIRHPNVVPVLDVVAKDGHLFLVMEYVHGEAASRLVMTAIRRRLPISPAIVSAIGIGMLEGLHAAHEAKTSGGKPLSIVHRDVSPQNVLIGADGVARMVDFGIAQAASRLHETTVGGHQKGKLKYMSPEQVDAKPLDRRTDLWAAGVVLWELLAQRRLFTAENDGATIRQILSQPIPAPSTFGKASPELDGVIERSLRRPADERFPDARTMALALEAGCPPASPREVGEWVTSLAGPQLAEREKMLEELDAVSLGGMPSVRSQLAMLTDPGAARGAKTPKPTVEATARAGPSRPVAALGAVASGQGADDLEAGRVLGGAYSIVRALGRGGMGTVYEGIQLALARRVAIKVLRELTAERAARFSLEAMAMAALQHPCIVQVSDFRPGTEDDPPFLVMELLEGKSLQELLKEEKKLDPTRAIAIAAQVLSALGTAHRAEIVHRDIKPANVFVIDHAGMALVKVLDFGIAKMMGDEGGPNTTTGMVFGSLAYLAPERLLDGPVDAKMDLYSTSVCLFEMLTGRRPFDGTTAEVMALLSGRAPAPDIRSLDPSLPPALAEVLARGLSKDPAQRWSSAETMRDALLAATGDPTRSSVIPPMVPSSVPPPPPLSAPPLASSSFEVPANVSGMPRAGGRWQLPFALGLGLALFGGAAYVMKTRIAPPPAAVPSSIAVVASAGVPEVLDASPGPAAPTTQIASAASAASATAAPTSSVRPPARRPPNGIGKRGTSGGDDLHLDHRK